MKKLDIQDLLEYSRAAVAVLRALAILDQTMSYANFARCIGLLDGPSDVWKAWHRQQVEAILKATAAVEGKAQRNAMPLAYERIVNQTTGIAGKGIAKPSRIITG